PVAIKNSDHNQIRSNDVAIESRNLLLLTGSMNAPALNTSGLSSRKSSGLFRNMTTIVRIPPIRFGIHPYDTAAIDCLKDIGADRMPFATPRKTAARMRKVNGVPTTAKP